jgi:methionyl-tRNA formyltransferase
VVFFGTPAFAVPTLDRILAGPHHVVAVVSQPDRPRGRGRKVSPSPVAERATRANVPLLRPDQVAAPEIEAALREAAPDVGVVVAFGQFLPKRLRELPARGYLMNAHASLLPRLRGAAPIARAILAGESETGISVMRVDREMDAGPVALVRRTAIDADEDAGRLEARLATIAAEAIEEALGLAASSQLVWTPQDATQATFAPKLEREEARLDFRDAAATLVRRVRAFAPRPGAFTALDGELLRILSASAVAEPTGCTPGTLRVDPAASALRIATGDGWLVPRDLQRAGGRVLDVVEFLRGARLSDGIVLGA